MPRDSEKLKNPLEELETIATAPVLLVASDYDGTLAPIVPDPARAFPERETMVALKALAAMPNTEVALISGRALRDLATLTGSPDSVHLVGSHGSEFDPGFAASLSPRTVRLLDRVLEEIEEIGGHRDGVVIERKPASVAFHYRTIENEKRAESLVNAVLEGPGAHPGVYVRRGKKVIELSVVATDKGAALKTIRRRVGASVAVYLGDDEADENAFDTLSGPDVAIKVGEGPTTASYRIWDTDSVARFLAGLAERRAAWLTGSRATPIDRHSLLSDQRTVALVADDARVTWFCIPRIDSPAIFGELIGGPTAGYFSISAADGSPPEMQSYQEDSMLLESRWPSFEVLDYLDCSGGRPLQRAGRTDLVRRIQGKGKVVVEFAPRLDFGRTSTRLKLLEGGLEVDGSPDPIVLRANGIKWSLHTEGAHETAKATIELGDEPVLLELRCGTRSVEPLVIPEARRREQSQQYWSDWVEQLQLPPVKENLVKRSAQVLRALCHGPSGGIAAAGTTSLPEHIGGIRNWDYRYSWLRDGAMSAEALVELGSLTEGMRFLDWLLGVLESAPAPEQLRPVYTVTGEELGIEAEIAELSGYAGSRPVRIGNTAARQLQLDVFGPVMSLVDALLRRGAPLSTEHWQLVVAMVKSVSKRWQEPDHGIWEIRGPRRHFVHSKVMCWQAIDRAVSIGQLLVGQEHDDWKALRDQIADEVLERGWKEQVGAFVAAYDGTDIDAAALQMGLSGLVRPDDPRFASTVEMIERFLRHGPTVCRYRYDDGLPGTEGGFHLCTSWLIDSYLLIGRAEDARQLFDELTSLSGPTALFSEEYDPQSGQALGNFPQAYSHLALIRNALNLAEAMSSPADE